MGRIDISSKDSPQSGREWRRLVPGVLVSLLALAILLYFVDLQQFKQAITGANYPMILVATLATLIWLAFRGIAWRTLLHNQASFSQVFLTLNEGYLLNNFLPLRLGEVGRAFLLSRKANLRFMRVVSSVVIERTLDIAMAVGLLLSSLPFVVGAGWALQAALAAGALVLMILAALYTLAVKRQVVAAWFERWTARWPRLSGLGGRTLPAFMEGLAVLTDTRVFLKAVLWMALNWLVGVCQYYLFLLAFFPEARLLWAWFGLGVVALGVAAPSSPGSLGVLELALVGALSVFDLDPSTVLAAALTLHLAQYMLTGLIGAYALALDGESLVGLYQKVRRIRTDDVKG